MKMTGGKGRPLLNKILHSVNRTGFVICSIQTVFKAVRLFGRVGRWIASCMVFIKLWYWKIRRYAVKSTIPIEPAPRYLNYLNWEAFSKLGMERNGIKRSMEGKLNGPAKKYCSRIFEYCRIQRRAWKMLRTRKSKSQSLSSKMLFPVWLLQVIYEGNVQCSTHRFCSGFAYG